jgi:hypothetical protein
MDTAGNQSQASGDSLRDGPVLPGIVIAPAVVFLFCPALILVMSLMSLMPEPLAERRARLWMAERLRERGYGTPAG